MDQSRGRGRNAAGVVPEGSAAEVAVEIVNAAEKGKAIAVVPAFPWKWLRPLFGLIPDALWRKMA